MQVNLLRQRGTFSAAGIGEQICQFTAELNASLMLVRVRRSEHLALPLLLP